MADRATGRYVGSAFINSSRPIRERLWKRVQEHAGPPPEGMKRPAAQWVKPGLIGRVKHLRGEENLRHASLQDFREEDDNGHGKGRVVPEYWQEYADAWVQGFDGVPLAVTNRIKPIGDQMEAEVDEAGVNEAET
ncbi:hypothetical protein [Mesorhizobium sp. AR07]|uniref:hypothetical protein n=1 Tax=Mesorhizobium sp. AR07 TaxID=2865838 RepID=UPI00215F9F33|nr:hypothetical protein [Mesorhizobium sp. AR07]